MTRRKLKKNNNANDKRGGRPRGTHAKGSRKESAPNNQPQSDEELLKIKLKAMAHGGYALGTSKRRTTFIPYAIPGETVNARIMEEKGNVDFAQGIELVEASADRVYPQCEHFGPGKCWGCQWQHINYKAQLLLKQDVLADQLYRIGKFEDDVLERAIRPVIPSPEQWRYNAHITMERDRDGNLGFYRMDGRSIEPVSVCMVLHPDLQALYEILEIDFDQMERLSLWRGSDGETMIIITMKSEEAPELSAELPTSVNVVLPDNEPVNLVGDSLVHFEVGGRIFRMTAGGSFRANIGQIDNLIAEVLNMLRLSDNDSVLDLYAGVGVFSAFMAPRAGLVTLVESYPPMATDAEENLQDFDNIDIIEGSVEEVLLSLIEANEIYEGAVIDPPPSGMSPDAIKSLLKLNIPRLVYVSSDPATLARDAQQFARRGYQLKRIQPIDFSPQTFYIDAVALLERD